MRKILTHFSRNFAKIAKEKSTSNCLLYEALYYIQTFSGSGHEKTQLMKLTFLREIDWSSSFPYEKNFVKSPNFLQAKYSVENYCKTLSQFLRKNEHFFRQINVFIKELTRKSWFHGNFWFSTFPHCTVWKNEKFYPH